MNIRVLVVDDSAFLRRMLSRAIDATPGFQVVGQAGDPFEARQALIDQQPDVVTLDINMPRLDGISFLERLMEHQPLPVLVLSGQIANDQELRQRCERAGASAVLAKPSADAIPAFEAELMQTLRRITAKGRTERPMPTPSSAQALRNTLTSSVHKTCGGSLIAIGASTGGTEAIRTVIAGLPAGLPPIVLVQHMPPNFTASFAQRLDTSGALRVQEAVGGETLKAGHAYLAPGGKHLLVKRQGSTFQLALDDGPRVHFQKPAVDVTFNSIAALGARQVVAAILTGMGRDGADGLLALRKAGARTIGQDESSCVVYGMPKAAFECGAVEIQLPLNKIAEHICQLAEGVLAHREAP